MGTTQKTGGRSSRFTAKPSGGDTGALGGGVVAGAPLKDNFAVLSGSEATSLGQQMVNSANLDNASKSAWGYFSTNTGFGDINSPLRLREFDNLSNSEINRINRMSDSVDETRLGKDISLYALITPAMASRMRNNPNGSFIDDGFMSTSSNRSFMASHSRNMGQTMMRIRAPSRTRGMFLDSVSRSRNKNSEFVMQRGTGLRYVSTETYTEGGITHTVHVVDVVQGY